MNILPYIDPDRELGLNVCIAMIILDKLSQTKRGSHILSIDRAQIYMHLAMRPKVLNDVLLLLSKKQIPLRDDEYFNVNAISLNSDFFYDRKLIKKIIALIGSLGFLHVSYFEKDGFVLSLTEQGKSYSNDLNRPYFDDVRKYSEYMINLQSVSINNLTETLNKIYGET